MSARQYGHHVGAYFVGHITVGSNAVCAHHYRVDLALAHHEPGHVVGDQGHRDIFLDHLPGSQTRTLQKRAGLVGDNGYAFARLDR